MNSNITVATTNVQVIKDLYSLFAQKDNEGIRSLMAADIEWIQMDGFPNGGRYIGPDAIFKGVFSGFRENWQEWKAVVTEYLDAGDTVIAIGFYEGTYLETAKSFRAEFAHLYTLKEGKIIRFVQYTDTFKVAEAMGMVYIKKCLKKFN